MNRSADPALDGTRTHARHASAEALPEWTSTDTLPPAPDAGPGRGWVAPAVLLGLVALTLVVAGVSLTQGTSGIGVGGLWAWVTGADGSAQTVVLGARLPRVIGAVFAGVVIGCAGVALQAVVRNPMASPDTLAVNAGAHLAVVVAAVLGLQQGSLPSGAMAAVGGLLAAAAALTLGGTQSPARLLLAGSALAMSLGSISTLIMVLRAEETTNLYAWGNGTLALIDSDTVLTWVLPATLVIAALFLAARSLDVLGLGDDTATSLGVNTAMTRRLTLLGAVLLTAFAVTVTGPLGFVGLVAPVVARLLGRWDPVLLRHRWLLPVAALIGVQVVLLSDVLLRLAVGSAAAVYVPTGVVTSMAGAALLVFLARRLRTSAPVTQAPSASGVAARSTRRFVLVLAALVTVLGAALIAGMLLGDRIVLLGDVANWWSGRAVLSIEITLDGRLPRVLAAVLGGAALAVAGVQTQAVARNPLAEPGLLGVTAGAGLGAVLVIVSAPAAGHWAQEGAALLGAAAATSVVYLLSRGNGLPVDRLVLVGIGTGAALGAVIAAVVVRSAPFDRPRAMTWLSGTSYGRQIDELLPVLLALVVIVPLVLLGRRTLDLLAVDDDTPAVLGVRLARARTAHIAGAVTLTAAAVCVIGPVIFVGLVAPHLARALVGGRHARVIPVAMIIGAVLVSIADTAGRTVIAPSQVPVGVAVALVGTPYFVWLLWRTNRPAAR